jgi:molybdopterin/thiamine biosynthesis adenylyltransferase
MEEISIIGLGGIGSHLANIIGRYVNSIKEETTINLIDGDFYEIKNLQRQEFGLGKSGLNKAEAQCLELKDKFKRIYFKEFKEYISEENIKEIIKENQTVFVCVDNHKTRKLISKFADTLQNIDIISGGNEYIDGNVQLYIRRKGEKITPSLTDYHKEIEEPGDKLPSELSCEELAMESAPQLLFTNLTVATLMCWVYYAKEKIEGSYNELPGEIYFNIDDMKLHAKQRKPKLN